MSAIAIRAYKVLQVDREATPEVIEATYRRLAKMHHPDVSSGRAASTRMAEINAAHDALKDPATRRAIDHELALHEARGRPADPNPAPPSEPPRPQSMRYTRRDPSVVPSAAKYDFAWTEALRGSRHAQRAIAIITFLVLVVTPLFDRFSEPAVGRLTTGMVVWAVVLFVQMVFDAKRWKRTPLGQILRLAARLLEIIAKEMAERLRRAVGLFQS